MKMRCFECHGELRPGHTTEFYTVAEHLYLVVERVPASVCGQCGASYTDRDTTDTLMRLVQRIRDNVPVGGRATLTYDFAAALHLARAA